MKTYLLAFLGALILTALGCGHSQKKYSEPNADFYIIDAHTHTHFSGEPESTSHILDNEKTYLETMRVNHVIASVVHTNVEGSDYRDLKKYNVFYCRGVSDSPDLKELEKGLKSKKYACIKIYLGYVHRYAYDQRYRPVYKLAEKYHVPVVFHTGDTYSRKAKLKYSDPLTIDEVAVDFPKVNFVIAHMGNPWIASAAEVAYKNPNVYVDVSALMIGNLNETNTDEIETYVIQPIRWAFGYIENPKKMMFGTDWPLTDTGSYVQAVKRAIPSEHWRAVFYDNAKRVFNLTGLPDSNEIKK